MRSSTSLGIRSLPALVLSAVVLVSGGCLKAINPMVEKIECKTDNNCPTGYTCVIPAGQAVGRCSIPGTTDGGRSGDSATTDGATVVTPSDTRVSTDGGARDTLVSVIVDALGASDTTVTIPAIDAQAGADVPVVAPDASPSVDTPGTIVDAPVQPPKDTAPPCNGGCCASADCPLPTPVCNSANKCVGCAADQDCAGRSATACNASTGACVQCTRNNQCGGATATCNTATNACVGCAQRSDCPGTCQTCANGSCVAIKNADDGPKCAGTCDSAGECRAKKGQGCTSVAGGCVTGTLCSPEGLCCDRACSGSCEACDLPASLGTCTTLPSGGQPHTGHAACAGSGPCAGTCAGAAGGACTYPTETCGTATCTVNSAQAVGTCAQGTCAMPAPVSCKTGATCAGAACACPLGTSDCGTSCADLGSDPKHCGACGHDCLGGPCEGGYCKPYRLGTISEGRLNFVASDGTKVYGVTEQQNFADTTKIWQLDAKIPGAPIKLTPEDKRTPTCYMDGMMVWAEGVLDDTRMRLGYCPVSGCLPFRYFEHAVTAGSTYAIDGGDVQCDPASKDVVWMETEFTSASANVTYSIWRATLAQGSFGNVRKITSFVPKTDAISSFYIHGFPAGRSDRIIFSRTGSSLELFSVSTTTLNATPVRLAVGAIGGPLETTYAQMYANDSWLVWSTETTGYRVPLPAGVGTATPPVFYTGQIFSGILDNHHFYGEVSNHPYFTWCSPPTCSAQILSNAFEDVKDYSYAQDSGAIYWGVMDLDMNGFDIWKVAKQPY